MVDLEKLARDRAENNTFMNYAHVSLVTLEPDYAKCQLPLVPDVCNGNGNIHGGALYTLADNAAGYAAHTDGRRHVTQNSSMQYLRNISNGTAIAVATIRHRGRSTCLVNVDITSLETGKLMATGSFTFFCIEKA